MGQNKDVEHPLLDKSSDRLGGSSGTGQQSPKLASTLNPAGRRSPRRGNTSCRQPISGFLIPAPDFLYSGTPEKSKKDEHEVRGTADVPPALFGISHHDIDRHRLLSEELYLAQNSSRSNTQTQNAHPGHRATEVVLGEGRNERRNVTPGVTGKLDENMPTPIQGAVATASAQVASTKKIAKIPKIKTGQQPTTTSNAKSQSPRVAGRQVCPPEQATRKDLPAGPFQKLNTQG